MYFKRLCLKSVLLISLCFPGVLLANEMTVLKLSKKIDIGALLAHSDGFLYGTSGESIYRIDPSSGKVTTHVTGLETVNQLIEGAAGSIIIAEWNTGKVKIVWPTGEITPLAEPELGTIRIMSRDKNGNLWVGYQWFDDINLYRFNQEGIKLNHTLIKKLSVNGAVIIGDDLYTVDNYKQRFYHIAKIASKEGEAEAKVLGKTKRGTGYNGGIHNLLYKDGIFYTADADGHVVYSITSKGEFKVIAGEFGRNGPLDAKHPNRLSKPDGLASFANSNKLYVTQSAKSSLLRIITLQ